MVIATLPEGEAGYAAYPARLEDFAIRHRERLRDLFTRCGPGARPVHPSGSRQLPVSP
ncbi:hypothetical protein ACFPZF_25000 [Kitasatospora cinereorecta]|uniref:Uncharacterized protein n=1 Tax=Kitasatospora cinereorecta TaxID=285560 RepID=A0ABW0VFD0_9ACTN